MRALLPDWQKRGAVFSWRVPPRETMHMGSHPIRIKGCRPRTHMVSSPKGADLGPLATLEVHPTRLHSISMELITLPLCRRQTAPWPQWRRLPNMCTQVVPELVPELELRRRVPRVSRPHWNGPRTSTASGSRLRSARDRSHRRCTGPPQARRARGCCGGTARCR